jgi:tRNA nucleotidyltransferase (CCA-adding enzyme)
MHFLKSSWGLDVFIMYPDVLPLEIEETWGLNQETTRTGRSQLFYGDKQTIL